MHFGMIVSLMVSISSVWLYQLKSKPSFVGHQLKVGANLWSHHVLADSIAPTDKEWSPTNQFKNYWGFEIDLLDDLAGALNFTYVIENPPVPSWGRLRGDGTWDGLLNLTMENKIDLAISNVHIMYARTQVH